MIRYYFELALRNFRRSPGLTALMLLTIAIGVGACMTTLTIFHVLSRDPIPHKSSQLYNVQLDAGRANGGFTPGGEPMLQLTRFDAEALLREARADRQVVMTGGGTSLTPGDGKERPFIARGRWASSDFFAMFDVPFLYGNGWSKADDANEARVVVISKALNERLFGGTDSRGKIIRLRDKDLSIIGVLNDWRPAPHYFDLTLGAYGDTAEVFAPFSTALSLKFSTWGNFNCWGNVGNDPRGVNAPCSWLQYWAQLDTPAKAEAYKDYLKQYSDKQRAANRFERPTNVRLRPVMEWMSVQQVVPADVSLQLWLAFGFLAVCLVNTVGLLLAKCLRRSGEIGVRRALGAPRRQIFLQFLVEAGSLGLVGGLLGLVLTGLGLWAVRQGSSDYAKLVTLDLPMLATTLVLAIVASLLAGLLPAWRATLVTPALQLKTQ
ncbi:ABC transporter permease [Pelomonas sp. SE-A7]|uniref:ABC transporter permease n=1 Tax=Pelomonas sp. SE-A7 TaxID=3054953 RepID=UPI00259D1519|nr:ABC transporter permease [Pelomonas sp. SE-A7]MDM4768032.1 ABC transporter permease [Pelomonas sp. SE-A7]